VRRLGRDHPQHGSDRAQCEVGDDREDLPDQGRRDRPFSLDELFARVRALLRRSSYDEPETELRVGDLRVDEAARRAWRGDTELELTKTEFELLQLLAHNAGVVLTRTTIYNKIWDYDFGPDSKALAVYISYLRRKLEADGGCRLIHTVRGVGYTMRES
jgi:two-component system response regulator MprA